MKIVYLRSLPYNNSKIYQQVYELVKKRANSFVYVNGDRIKKICSCNCDAINNLVLYGDNISKPYEYEIYLIDPTDQNVLQAKLQILKKQKQQFQAKIARRAPRPGGTGADPGQEYSGSRKGGIGKEIGIMNG